MRDDRRGVPPLPRCRPKRMDGTERRGWINIASLGRLGVHKIDDPARSLEGVEYQRGGGLATTRRGGQAGRSLEGERIEGEGAVSRAGRQPDESRSLYVDFENLAIPSPGTSRSIRCLFQHTPLV